MMIEKEFATIPVEKLISDNFKVPEYQRGYKWTEDQVETLLEDIDKFELGENGAADFYCLQPVVVKKEEGCWELIDGQQRITTIWMIMAYLGAEFRGSLDYKTREGSGAFLSELKAGFVGIDIVQNEEDNIDVFYFKGACRLIKEWFKDKEESKVEKWREKLLEHSKVIWYAVDSAEDSKGVFSRLNSGKIPLTNAELIKALFLINSVADEPGGGQELKKSQMAREWDEIENGLQKEDFWCFLNGGTVRNSTTRIEFIFDLIQKRKDKNDRYFTFDKYSEELKDDYGQRAKKVADSWETVKRVYYSFCEWYEDDKLHTRVGFLLSCRKKSSVLGLYEISKGKKKSEFLSGVKSKIGEKLLKLSSPSGSGKEEAGDKELFYGENNDAIHDRLFWFNIYTHEKNKTRFPFRAYNLIKKEGGWSLEHIHAQQSQDLDVKDCKKYAESCIKTLLDQGEVSEEACKKIQDELNQLKPDESKDDEEKLRERIDELEELIETHIGAYGGHGLANMALLSKVHNSSLNNKVFSAKREVLQNKEKLGEYIPIATKRVFSKYYSESVKDLFKWSEKDKEGYALALQESLTEFRELAKKGEL